MTKDTTVLACALALGTALVVPDSITAQTSNPSPLAKLAHLIAVIRTETVATREELQATLNAPIRQEKGDLQPTIEPDTAEVKKTHAVADQTTARSSAMPEASKEYLRFGRSTSPGSMTSRCARRRISAWTPCSRTATP